MQKRSIRDWLLIGFFLYLGVAGFYSAYVTLQKSAKEEDSQAFKEAVGNEECEECKDNFVPLKVPKNAVEQSS